jgi:D-alanyl-D-alanine carboxypeptidase
MAKSKTKTKRKTNKAAVFIGVVVTLGLMLGVMIQLTLAANEQRLRWQAGERLARAMSTTAVQTLEARHNLEAETVRAAKLALAGQPEARAAQRAQEQPELLLLVNPWNELPEDYDPELQQVGREFGTDYMMDQRCADKLEQMIADCREGGGHPWICSAYRTQKNQQDLFDNKVLRVILEGSSAEEAPDIAAKAVARPGTSEHQLGMAVDIIDEYYPILDEGQEETATQNWLMKNCWRYGFILRYPNGTTDITGIIYEPWHYRYVGERYAEEITGLGITLEEYLQMRRGR